MRLLLILTLIACFLSTVYSQSCQPECSWACDNPTCDAICEPVCEAPNCTLGCTQGSFADCGLVSPDVSSRCFVRCPTDACAAENCPQCETVCQNVPCPNTVECAPLCETTNCSWKCRSPTNCPRPTCELQCQEPACAYVPESGAKETAVNLVVIVLMVLFFV